MDPRTPRYPGVYGVIGGSTDHLPDDIQAHLDFLGLSLFTL